jgi:primosomal protein N' (replication factor Y)
VARAAPAAQVQLLVEARALDRPLDYAVPQELDDRAVRGALVACPLGPRRVLGVVLGREPATHAGALQPLAGAVDVPPVDPALLDLATWMARYYLAPLAACLRLVLPPGAEGALRRDREGRWRLAPPSAGAARLVACEPRPGGTPRQRAVAEALADAGGRLAAAELCRRAGTTLPTLRRMAAAGLLALRSERPERSALDWFGAGPAPPAEAPPAELTADQAAAVAALEADLERGGGVRLLHGVTGSGKTEVYLRAIEAARRAGRGSIVLAPEIALTPQLLRRLRARLGEGVAAWHSALAQGERAAEHARVRDGRADVVIGPRSAIFAPLPRLGLIVVDEEHDPSYKQETTPRYDARQVAFRRAGGEGAVLVVGSATPRPESWRALERLTLASRVDGAPLPAVEVVDMRTQGPGPLSRPLAAALEDAARRGERAVILLNRRGMARMALCRACGWIGRCGGCDVALVVHGPPLRLVCHHCGAGEPLPAVCPRCRAAEVARQGSGTAGLDAAVARLLPGVRRVRLDAESAAPRGALPRLLAEFAGPGPAILLGTQMVAKGHDLPEVTVAAVLDADGPLQYPDFRAEERAFALIVQLAGRAGRRGETARVIVQALEPLARVVQMGAAHDVEGFLRGELERRRERGLPPFGHLARLVLDGGDAAAVARLAGAVADEVRLAAPGVEVLGPAPLHRLRGRSRRAVLARAGRAREAALPLRRAVDRRQRALARAGVRAALDVDPQST